MFQITRNLISSLNHNRVIYCHWKSNVNLVEACNGYDDLDLLIDPNSFSIFNSIINELGFKQGLNFSQHHWGVLHFYGLDSLTGEILHLHVYLKIVTGASLTKPIHIPLENFYLGLCSYHETGFKVPQKHLELFTYLIRLSWKYTGLVEIVLLNREKNRIIKELNYLYDNNIINELSKFLDQNDFGVSIEHVTKFVNVLYNGNFIAKFFYAFKFRYQAKVNVKHNFIYRLFNGLKIAFMRISTKIFKNNKKILLTGGRTIAIVGLDGSGKSTVVGELEKWLKIHFQVNTCHFGKPRSSFRFILINVLIKLLRKFKKLRKEIRANNEKVDYEGQYSFFYSLRNYVLSYDRMHIALKMHGFSLRGKIVLFDRYKSASRFMMDSPRLCYLRAKGINKVLAKIEEYNYSRIPSVDILIHLKVDVENAVKRNHLRVKTGKESEEFIRKRYLINDGIEYESANILNVNSDVEIHEMLLNIKTYIWSKL